MSLRKRVFGYFPLEVAVTNTLFSFEKQLFLRRPPHALCSKQLQQKNRGPVLAVPVLHVRELIIRRAQVDSSCSRLDCGVSCRVHLLSLSSENMPRASGRSLKAGPPETVDYCSYSKQFVFLTPTVYSQAISMYLEGQIPGPHRQATLLAMHYTPALH